MPSWRPLPRIAFAICTYPFQPTSTADLPLEIGDELYIIEQGGIDGSWYRGYLVAPPSLLAGLTTIKGQTLEARVFTGIFPRSCVEVRELLGDASSNGQANAATEGKRNGGPTTHTSPSEGQEADSQRRGSVDSRSRRASSRRKATPSWASKSEQLHQLLSSTSPIPLANRDPSAPRPPAPVPMLKIGDESPTSVQEPLVDEISSALREWHATRLHELLLSRSYNELDQTSDLVNQLNSARRQLLHKILTAQELVNLREETVWDLVRGNKLLSGEVIVRSPQERGRMLTSDDSAVEITRLQSIMSTLDERPIPTIDEHTLHHLYFSVKQIAGNGTPSAVQLNIYLCAKVPGEGPKPVSEVYTIDMASVGGNPGNLPPEKMRVLFTDLSSVDIGEGSGSGTKLFLVIHALENESHREIATVASPGFSRQGSISGSPASSPLMSPPPSAKGRRSLMFGSKARKDADAPSSPLPARSPGHKRAQSSQELRPPSSSRVQSPKDKLVKRSAAVGICQIDDLLRAKSERDVDIALWTPASAFDELDESDTWNEVVGELLQSATGRYKKLEVVSRCSVTLKSFQNVDADILVTRTPTLLHNITQTRKIGFAGAPTKPRSDIYLTISDPFLPRNAFLSHPKSGTVPLSQHTSMANLQLTIEVRRSTGQRIENCIYPSCNSIGHTAWRTTAIERGEGWGLTVKLAIKPEDVPGCHLVMSIADSPHFPFALCWMPLWTDDAFVRDGDHSLALYKYDEHTSNMIAGRGAYLQLPWSSKRKDESVTGPVASLRLRTYLCSTQYSQDPNLLGLLRWREQDPSGLAGLLKRFTFVPEIEIVKLLNEVFDTLFEILKEQSGNDEFEDLIFNALVLVFGIVHDRRFNLGPLVDRYAEERFKYPFATSCLLRSFTRLLDNPTDPETSRQLRSTLKVGAHMFKFILSARKQQKEKEADIGITSRGPTFNKDLQRIFQSLGSLMLNPAPILVGTKTLVVQNFHTWLPALWPAMTAKEILDVATEFIAKCKDVQGKIILYKLVMISNFMQLDVFRQTEVRPSLLRLTVDWLAPYWGKTDQITEQRKDQVRLCCSILSLQATELDGEICDYVPKLLDSYISIQMAPRIDKSTLSLLFPTSYPFPTRPASSKLECDEALVETAALMASFTRHRNAIHEDSGTSQATDLLLKALQVYSSILDGEAFPRSWLSTYIYHHRAIAEALNIISECLINSHLPDPDSADLFNTDLWRAFFDVLLKLVASDALALEAFPEQKRRAVWKIAGDVRELGSRILHKTWNAIGWETSNEDRTRFKLDRMGGYQVQYVPGLIAPIVELCLSVHEGLRSVAIEILHTMIVSEWTLSQDLSLVQTEMIDCLDHLFKSKPLNESMIQKAFIIELVELFEPSEAGDEDEELYGAIKSLFATIDILLELLVAVHSTEATGEIFRIMDTLHLMDFLKDMQKEDIYVKYVHQLAQLQAEVGNNTEAGLALRLHAELYDWDPTMIVEATEDPSFPAQTAFERKEAIYFQMVKYFEDGSSWDNALGTYLELATQYEHNMFDFAKLARTQRAMATIYESISKGERPVPRYFRVVYKGLGWPVSLRDKQFIFEGSPYDRLPTFADRLQSQHPAAQIVPANTEPDDVEGQFLQIYAVTPQRDLLHPIYQRAKVGQPIRDYYLLSRPNHFTMASRRHGGDNVKEQTVVKTMYSTAESFPTILRRSEIVSIEDVTLPPLQSAIERTTRKTSELYILERRAAVGDDAALSLLTEAITASVDPTSETSVTLYRELLPKPRRQSMTDEFEEEEEVPLEPLENALKVALADHALMIKRCLGAYTRSAHQATRADLAQRFESTFALELETLNPISQPTWNMTSAFAPHPHLQLSATPPATSGHNRAPSVPTSLSTTRAPPNGTISDQSHELSQLKHKRQQKSRLSLTFLKRSSIHESSSSAAAGADSLSEITSTQSPIIVDGNSNSISNSNSTSARPPRGSYSRDRDRDRDTALPNIETQRNNSVSTTHRNGSVSTNHITEADRAASPTASDSTGKPGRLGSVKKRFSALNLGGLGSGKGGLSKKRSRGDVKYGGTIRE